MLLPRRCPGCGQPHRSLCPRCRAGVGGPVPVAGVPGVDELVAWSTYAGPARAVVLALKHHGRRDVAGWLGRELAAVAPAGLDGVTWVPASVTGRRRRGFDQGALLARSLARHLDLPAAPLLRRPRAAASQRGRSRAERLEGAAPRARRRVGGRVLVVDDVVTTGASLARAAATLRAAGASGVSAIVVAVADRDLGPWSGSPPVRTVEPHATRGGSRCRSR